LQQTPRLDVIRAFHYGFHARVATFAVRLDLSAVGEVRGPKTLPIATLARIAAGERITMQFVSGERTLPSPTSAKLRVLLTYLVPALAVFYVVVSGLWLVPDSYAGMYGNFDGHWTSWNARGILKWSTFLDFSPFSPFVGTGSLFAPFLPWVNPGALVLGIPAPLPLRHLASMLVYLAELSVTLYLLYRHLEFSRGQSFLATLLYICIFFIPLQGFTDALPWYILLPMGSNVIASMNVATIALIRVGYEGFVWKLFFSFVFVVALFVAFASAPVNSITYVPTYAALWIAFLIPFQARSRAALWRCGAIVFALLVLGLIGIPQYLAATAMTSARGNLPPMFHPAWQLLSPSYWQHLVSEFPLCWNHWQLMCPSSVIGWFEIAALVGSFSLLWAGAGVKRRYGLVIIALLALTHFYALLSVGKVLGRIHTVSPPYLMWAFFPLAMPAAVVAGSTVASWVVGRRVARSPWMPAVVSCLLAAVAVFVWIRFILPYLPRLPGEGPLGLPPIAHLPVNKGPILDYLQRHIGLKPGGEFRGYASTFLGAPDGVVHKSSTAPSERVTYETYIAAREMLFNNFGNSFQNMDLLNSDIPTLEEYGQWVSKQMYYFDRDLLAEPQDVVDPLQSIILVYRFRPLLLRALGVRFVIADGTLAGPSTEYVMTESGKNGTTINLYEIKGANLGQFSPTHVTWAADYGAAVTALRRQSNFEANVVLLGHRDWEPELVPAARARLVAIKDGYQFAASAPGTAMVVLPVQYSRCWRIENASKSDVPRIFRANVVQTGILFKGAVDFKLRFDFEPWKSTCRLEDARDISLFGFK
jgi:hypothetical protein